MITTNSESFAVLIVEDHPSMRLALREMLQSAYPDAAISEAANGGQALEMCLSHSPRLVLMDISLPDVNGIDLTARIRTMLPECQVIIVSQHAALIYIERAQEAGACAYITKDTVYRTLLPAVAAALADRTLPHAV